MRLRVLTGLVGVLIAGLLPAPAWAQAGDTGTVSISVRPPTAEIYIDGERWVSPDTSAPLVVQLPQGQHTVQVRAPGCRSYNTSINVHSGEATPLNIILPSAGAPGAFGEVPPAQGPPPQGPPAPGQIVQVSRRPTEDGFVFATDVKITDLNNRTTSFLGFYGGAVVAGQVMIGGGAYFQLDDYYHNNSEQMVYGGFVSEYRLFHDQAVGITLHGLAGWGAANIGYYNYNGDRIYADPRHGGYNGYYYGYPYGYAYEGFFVGEPMVQVAARIGNSARLVGGIGYRWTSADFQNLNGIVGNVAFQFGR